MSRIPHIPKPRRHNSQVLKPDRPSFACVNLCLYLKPSEAPAAVTMLITLKIPITIDSTLFVWVLVFTAMKTAYCYHYHVGYSFCYLSQCHCYELNPKP